MKLRLQWRKKRLKVCLDIKEICVVVSRSPLQRHQGANGNGRNVNGLIKTFHRDVAVGCLRIFPKNPANFENTHALGTPVQIELDHLKQ